MIFKTRPKWIDLFAVTMTKLGVRADPYQIVDLAEVMYDIHSDLDPRSVARAEMDKWPVQLAILTGQARERNEELALLYGQLPRG